MSDTLNRDPGLFKNLLPHTPRVPVRNFRSKKVKIRIDLDENLVGWLDDFAEFSTGKERKRTALIETILRDFKMRIDASAKQRQVIERKRAKEGKECHT